MLSFFLLSVKGFFIKAPTLSPVLAMSIGIWTAGGTYVLAIIAGFFFLWGARSTRWGVTALSLLCGVGVYFSHSEELEKLQSSADLFTSYSMSPLSIEVREARISEVSRLSYGYLSTVHLLQPAILSGTGETLPAGLRLRAFSDYELFSGEVVRFSAHVRERERGSNFSQVDWRELGQRRGEAQSILIREHERVHLSGWRERTQIWRKGVREYFRQCLSVGVPEGSPSHRLLPALLFGEKPAEREWTQPYRDAGVIHMFVVSGLHVGMVMGVVYIALYFFPLSTRVAVMISLLVAWGYAWVSGMQPPVMRSVLVISLYFSGFLFHRRVSAMNSLSVAFLLVIALDRFSFYDVGVWLSFGVVGGLILVGSYFLRRGEKVFSPDPYLPKVLWSPRERFQASAGKWMLGGVVTSVVAWGCSSVITALTLGKIYLYGVLSSWLILPVLFLMMSLSLSALLVSPFFSGALPVINGFNHTLSQYVEGVVSRVHSLPSSVYHLKGSGYKDALTVFHSTDGGNALYLGMEGGILIDTGSHRFTRGVLLPILDQVGQRVNTVLVSHRDSAHQGGVELFPEEKVHYAGESESGVLSGDMVRVETLPVKVEESKRADDEMALFRIQMGAHSIGYIADAGYPILKKLKDGEIPFPCEVLIIGENSHGEDALREFCSYTGAHSVILSETYYYQKERSIPGVMTYDQRYCGAVRIKLQDGNLQLLPKRVSAANTWRVRPAYRSR